MRLMILNVSRIVTFRHKDTTMTGERTLITTVYFQLNEIIGDVKISLLVLNLYKILMQW